MKSLAKMDRVLIAGYLADVRSEAAAVETAKAALAETFATLCAPLNAAIEAYNEKVLDLNEMLDAVSGQIDDFMSERSDRWREGEAASRYAAWRDAFEEAKLEPLDHPEMPDLTIEPVSPDDTLPLRLEDVA